MQTYARAGILFKVDQTKRESVVLFSMLAVVNGIVVLSRIFLFLSASWNLGAIWMVLAAGLAGLGGIFITFAGMVVGPVAADNMVYSLGSDPSIIGTMVSMQALPLWGNVILLAAFGTLRSTVKCRPITSFIIAIGLLGAACLSFAVLHLPPSSGARGFLAIVMITRLLCMLVCAYGIWLMRKAGLHPGGA